MYRIFTSRTTSFYGGHKDVQVYVVELLRPTQYGDPFTTLLLKALEVSLSYRFMFPENNSEFSPDMVPCCP
jgi:hypothetical protein